MLLTLRTNSMILRGFKSLQNEHCAMMMLAGSCVFYVVFVAAAVIFWPSLNCACC